MYIAECRTQRVVRTEVKDSAPAGSQFQWNRLSQQCSDSALIIPARGRQDGESDTGLVRLPSAASGPSASSSSASHASSGSGSSDAFARRVLFRGIINE